MSPLQALVEEKRGLAEEAERVLMCTMQENDVLESALLGKVEDYRRLNATIDEYK